MDKAREKLEKLKRELEKLGKSEATASTALEIAQSKLHTAVGPRESKLWKIIIQEIEWSWMSPGLGQFRLWSNRPHFTSN